MIVAVDVRSSELQPAFAGRVGQGRDATVVVVCRRGRRRRPRSRRPWRARRASCPTFAAWAFLSPSSARTSASMVDAAARVWPARSSTICAWMCRERAVDDQARTLGGAGDLLAQPEVATRLRPRDASSTTSLPSGPLGLLVCVSAHHHLPVFPTLRRICSPSYRTPLPLYGSGLRSRRMLAAIWPTFCLSMPCDARTGWALSTANVMPSGGVDRHRVAVAERELQVVALGAARGNRRRGSPSSCCSPR